MPADAGDLMVLAAKRNGLTSPEMKPWHLKASYATFDSQGNIEAEGTIDEWWAQKHKARISFHSGGDTQTTYYTDAGSYQSGEVANHLGAAEVARQDIVEPLPSPEFLQTESFSVPPRDPRGSKLLCVVTKESTSDQRLPSSTGATYCFDSDKPILRLIAGANGWEQTVRNKFVTYQGKYLPTDVKVAHGTRTSVTMHLDSLETIKTVDEATFTPPADAVRQPQRVLISSGTATGMLATQVKPVYPPIAKAAHVQGEVVLDAAIGSNGHVQSLRVVSGPPMLLQAATDTVEQWTYRPYILNGEQVEVETTVNVIFHLGG